MIVTLEDAGLWTDGRYFIQAEKQLQDSGITLYRMGLDGVPTVNTYLDNVLKDGQVLGCDGRMVTTTWLMAMKRRYKVKSNVDLVGDIWQERRAPKTANMGIGAKVCRGQQRSETVPFMGLDETKEFGLFYTDIFG